jgi:hypothetical protein
MIGGVARGFFEDASREVFDQPQIAAGVVTFHLMSRGGAAPEKFIGESLRLVRRAATAGLSLLVVLARDLLPTMPTTVAAEAPRNRFRRVMGLSVDSATGAFSSFMIIPRPEFSTTLMEP